MKVPNRTIKRIDLSTISGVQPSRKLARTNEVVDLIRSFIILQAPFSSKTKNAPGDFTLRRVFCWSLQVEVEGKYPQGGAKRKAAGRE
jgi:hypothetical protein